MEAPRGIKRLDQWPLGTEGEEGGRERRGREEGLVKITETCNWKNLHWLVSESGHLAAIAHGLFTCHHPREIRLQLRVGGWGHGGGLTKGGTEGSLLSCARVWAGTGPVTNLCPKPGHCPLTFSHPAKDCHFPSKPLVPTHLPLGAGALREWGCCELQNLARGCFFWELLMLPSADSGMKEHRDHAGQGPVKRGSTEEAELCLQLHVDRYCGLLGTEPIPHHTSPAEGHPAFVSTSLGIL